MNKTNRPIRLLAALVVSLLCGCTTMNVSPEPAGTIVWKLDNIHSIGGKDVQVLGEPKVVDLPDGKALRFNGESDGLFLPINPLEKWNEFTIELLICPIAGGPLEQRFMHIQSDAGPRSLMELRMYEKGWALDAFLLSGTSQKALFDQTKLNPADRWTWVAMTYRDGTITDYVNGVQQLQGQVTFPPTGPGQTSLGVRQNKVSWFKGMIREARFTPKALQPSLLKSQ